MRGAMDEECFTLAALTRFDLDRLVCTNSECGCNAVKLDNICHPTAGFDVEYHAEHGILIVVCRACERPASIIEVAPGAASHHSSFTYAPRGDLQ